MQANEERWKELCRQASVEQDPKKLVDWRIKAGISSRPRTIFIQDPGPGVDIDEAFASTYPDVRAYLPVNRPRDFAIHSW